MTVFGYPPRAPYLLADLPIDPNFGYFATRILDLLVPGRFKEMPNRLSLEPSPYLLQHRDTPVDWYPWGPEALQRAREEDKPILLSVGYSACPWGPVMGG